jgi:hypothetical protein
MRDANTSSFSPILATVDAASLARHAIESMMDALRALDGCDVWEDASPAKRRKWARKNILSAMDHAFCVIHEMESLQRDLRAKAPPAP